MKHLKKFITFMEKASTDYPMMKIWLYGTKELEHQLSERLIRLCIYPDMIPEVLLATYADVLIEALEKEGTNFTPSKELKESLIVFSSKLFRTREKARRIQELIEQGA